MAEQIITPEAAQAAVNAAYAAKRKIVADQKAEIAALKNGKHKAQLKAANAMIARALAENTKVARAAAKAEAKAAAEAPKE